MDQRRVTALFFLVVGLEIRREFTVGRLSTRRAAILPLAAAAGGIVFPALLYVLVVPKGYLASFAAAALGAIILWRQYNDDQRTKTPT